MPAGQSEDPHVLLQGLKRGFHRVDALADGDASDDAASELTTVYMTEFEPLERLLLGRTPQEVRPLEIEFNALRGDLAQGSKERSWRPGSTRCAQKWSARLTGSRPSLPADSGPHSSRRSSRYYAKASKSY